MLKDTDSQSHPLTEVLSHLNPAEQLQVIITHPFFTGKCPECKYQFPLVHSTAAHCNCPECGWTDDLGNSQKAIAANDSPEINHTNVKCLGSYLVEAGLLTQAQVEAALTDQAESEMRFGEVLVKLGLINQQTIEFLMQKVILPERAVAQRNPLSRINTFID
jgi:Zn finger protein HypA/HybF involved in hydrogenase expression